ncbi:MAG: hypothetical protein U0V70_01025 [Terriglobia bacterium]
MIEDAMLKNPAISGLQKRFFAVGGLFLTLCLGGAISHPDQFFRSYLFAFVFWSSIPLGSLAILMLQYLTGGAWGMMIRRLLEASTRSIPWMAALFVPILFGMRHLYEWAQPEKVRVDKILQHKALYLNIPFFVARTVFYFLVWYALVRLFDQWSRRQDEKKPAPSKLDAEGLSGPGLVIFGATMTFASFDWVMSLEPHWYSTMFGLYIMVGQTLTTFAFTILVLILLSKRKPMSEALTPEHLHDLGKLTLAFVMIWAYLAFSQFLIIWSGNLPEETPYYLKRLAGGWGWLQIALILFHFALPFILLLSRSLKKAPRQLLKVVALILVMRLVDLYLQIAPASHGAHFQVHWMDLAALLGIGGVFLGFFIRSLMSRPILPLHDPAFEEALHSGH